METARRWATRVRSSTDTNARRCPACIVLNGMLALILGVLIGVVWIPAGVVSFAAFVGIIVWRGSLVPGMASRLGRYMPAPVRSWIEPANGRAAVIPLTDGGEILDTERRLRMAGVIEPAERGDSMQLTDRFHDIWWRRIQRFQDDERAISQLATIIEVDPEKLSYEASGDRLVIAYDDSAVGGWISEAALIADLAVESTLREWIADWEELRDERRCRLIACLRAFLEACPRCESALEVSEDVRQRCVSDQVDSETVDCDSCGDLVFGKSPQ